jgi:hypothetical protein
LVLLMINRIRAAVETEIQREVSSRRKIQVFWSGYDIISGRSGGI